MRIGRSSGTSAISNADAASVTIRGYDLTGELMGQIGFSEFFHLLLTGTRPSAVQRDMLDAVLIAIAEHGLTPSVQAARMTLAAAPEAMQGAVAAGIAGCGSTVLGTTEAAGAVLRAGVARMRDDGVDADEAARAEVAALRATGERVPGFGHPLHRPVDPRAARLFAMAEERGVAGDHVAMAHGLQRAAEAILDRPMVANVSLAIPAVMLDVDYPPTALSGLPILARTAGLIAHLAEERESPIGFHMSHAAAEAVRYDGPASGASDGRGGKTPGT